MLRAGAVGPFPQARRGDHAQPFRLKKTRRPAQVARFLISDYRITLVLAVIVVRLSHRWRGDHRQSQCSARGRGRWVASGDRRRRSRHAEARQVCSCDVAGFCPKRGSRGVPAGDDSIVGPALSLLWASQHLNNLRRLGVRLIQPAAKFSSKGARSDDQP